MPESIADCMLTKPARRVSRNVIMLGWVSLLTDLASEMLYPIIPVFITTTLGASPAIVGLIDGVAEGGSSVLRWLSGAMSDRYRNRKPFLVAGYGLSALSKPLIGLAAFAIGWPLVLAARCLDRVGKSSPSGESGCPAARHPPEISPRAVAPGAGLWAVLAGQQQ